MAEFVITIQRSGQHFSCTGDEYVLKAMERHGLRTIAVGCRGGGCGVCRVRVLRGNYVCGPMSKAQVSTTQQQQGYALACRLKPTGDLVLECSPSPLAINGFTDKFTHRRSRVAQAKQPQTEVIK